jgi:long-chain acyl-CoA synthetase
VALTHANISSNSYASIDAIGEQASDRRLNFLPFSHIYARTCDLYTWIAKGSELALARTRDTILADCQIVKPTLMNGVPYFYERIAQKVAESEKSDRPITLQQVLGGNIRACFCGGAPLPVGTFDFFHSRGVPLLPGYGLTESSPVISFSTMDQCRRGTVGKPIPGIEVRFAEDGELLTRGPHVMLEYWKDPELTRQTIRDGWLYTGDLGSVDADGYISITGRKKEMIALSTGKKVTPTHIEGLLCREPFILQALVIGNDQKYLAALIVPNPDTLKGWIATQQLQVASPAEVLTHPRVLEQYANRIAEVLATVAPYEQVKRFVLLGQPFTIDNGLLTPKLSMRRDQIHKRYEAEIASLYAKGGTAVQYDSPTVEY